MSDKHPELNEIFHSMNSMRASDMERKTSHLVRIAYTMKCCNIDDILSDRTFQVRIGDKLSDTLQLDNETPQGSRSSPLLFLIQINDFPGCRGEHEPGNIC